ncbi:MAG TPA: hypothetical protein VGP72_12995 [Planctomycetota bacterium]|jgi:WD40 repeat protein
MKLPRPRFSLRTLILFVLSVGSAMLLYHNKAAWMPKEFWRTPKITDPNRRRVVRPDFSPDGRYMTAVCEDRKTRVWEISSGRVISVIEAVPLGESIFSPDARYLALEKERGVFDLWHLETRAHTGSFDLNTRGNPLNVVFGCDGKHLFGRDGFHVRCWTLADARLLYQVGGLDYNESQDPVEQKRIKRACEEACAATDLDTLRHIETSAHIYLDADISSDGRLILTHVNRSMHLQLWDAVLGRRLQVIELPACFKDGEIDAWLFSKDSSRLAVRPAQQRQTYIWDAQTGQLVRELSNTLLWDDRSTFSDDKQWLICAGESEGAMNSTVNFSQVLGVSTAAAGTRSKGWRNHTWPIFSRDARRCIVEPYPGEGELDWRVGICDAFSGQKLFCLSASQDDDIAADYAVFTPGGQVATDGPDGSLLVWSRRRPEYWWGIAWLPEFWLTVVFSAGLVWSVWRDRRSL